MKSLEKKRRKLKSLIEVMVFCYDEGKTRAEALASHPDLDVVIRPQRREFDDVVVEVYSDLRIPSIDLEEISMMRSY